MKVLKAALDANTAGDYITQVRWLKFWRLFGQIMLRNPPRGGRRGHNVLPARFAALSRGDFRVLVDWWEFDNAKIPESRRPADRSREKLVEKAVRYAERPGGARECRHDEFVYVAAADLQYNGIPTVVEPRNLVNSWMTPGGHARMSRAEAQRPLQGCIPDLLTTEVPGDKLRNKDQAYHNTAPGAQGPMEAALYSFGGCSGLVGGFYGEMSKSVDALVKAAARVGAERHAARMGFTDSKYIRSVLTNKIRTNWAMALFRGNAGVKISNVRWVRGASAPANAGDGADRDGRWRDKREEYRYAHDEYRGPRMGGFGGRHCK